MVVMLTRAVEGNRVTACYALHGVQVVLWMELLLYALNVNQYMVISVHASLHT